jgi:hypothetical protein
MGLEEEKLDNIEPKTNKTNKTNKTRKIGGKKYYFDNEAVEEVLTKYVIRGCVDIELRNEVMSHASELIRQIIRAHNFEYIFPGRDQSSFYELYQVAWMQIEKTLYKYKPEPGSPKVFNLWSQIAKTRILAYLKKEKRDKKNVGNYRDYLSRKYKTRKRDINVNQWIAEAREMFDYSDDYLEIIDAIGKLWEEDEKPYDGFITKLEKTSGKNRNIINTFLKSIRLRRDEFTINLIAAKSNRDFDPNDLNTISYHYNENE